MKQYIGIDIAKHEHVAASRYENGEAHGKAFAFANDDEGFRSLLARFRELGATPLNCLVVMESTGHYWMALWEFLAAHGFGIAIVNPVLTDAFRKAGTMRKTKTDKVDAKTITLMLATESADNAYSLQAYQNEELKSLTRYRFDKVNQRSKLKQSLSRLITLLFTELESAVSICNVAEISERKRYCQISAPFSDKSFEKLLSRENR